MGSRVVRECRKCGKTKPESEFYMSQYTKQDGSRSRYSYCAECTRADANAYYRGYGNKKARENAWARQGIDFSVEEYEAMLRAQDGACAICGTTSNRSGRRLAVDHCHGTGSVRGILCSNCNVAIGRLGDGVDLMYRAISYLEQHELTEEVC